MIFLDVTLTKNTIILIILALIFITIFLYNGITYLKKKAHDFEITTVKLQGEINERNTFIGKIQADTNGYAQEIADKKFEEWKRSELEKYVKVIHESSTEKYTALLRQWIMDNEDRIRKDAANRSVRNVLGKVTEHLIPFSEAMKQFNPKDIRFIGSPIDLIVFEGAEELKQDEIVIHFVEVKTGTSALSKRQKLIMEAVKAKRVEWLRVDMKSFGDGVNDALSQ